MPTGPIEFAKHIDYYETEYNVLKKLAKTLYIIDIVIRFLDTIVIGILLYIITSINNPKINRRDIRTGKSVSLLVFVQSRMQM